MDRYKAPRDKLLCLVNVKTMVENIVGLAAKAGASIGGAPAAAPGRHSQGCRVGGSAGAGGMLHVLDV